MKAGRTLLTSVAVLTAAGGFFADLNKTHMFNPRWTPHARFHDAMTILMACILGTTATCLLTERIDKAGGNLEMGTLLPAISWISLAGSFAFPGAEGIEAEFPEKVKKAGPLVLNEGFVSALMLSLLLTGYVVEKKLKE